MHDHYQDIVTDSSFPMQVSDDALSSDFRQRLRMKAAQAVELALDVVIASLEGTKKVKRIQLAAARMMIPFAPRIEHGAAPLTLILPGVPRPQVIEAKILPTPAMAELPKALQTET